MARMRFSVGVSTTHNRSGYAPEVERDFQDQEVEALGHRVLFYSKSHCELDFTEHYWCRENCGFDFEALRTTVPVTLASIRGFYRLALRAIDACSADPQYGIEGFKRKVYKSHWQVEDRSKW